MTDMYEVLGVPRDASPDAIRKAYKRLAMRHHPDRPNGSQAAFLPVQAAYDVLSDPAARQRYDQTGQTDRPQIDQMAVEKFMQLLNTVLDQDRLPPGGPMMFLHAQLDQAQGQLDSALRGSTLKLELLTKKSKRLKVKSGENLFARLLDQRQRDQRAHIAKFEQELEILAKVRELLDNYEDGEEPAPHEQWTVTSSAYTVRMP